MVPGLERSIFRGEWTRPPYVLLILLLILVTHQARELLRHMMNGSLLGTGSFVNSPFVEYHMANFHQLRMACAVNADQYLKRVLTLGEVDLTEVPLHQAVSFRPFLLLLPADGGDRTFHFGSVCYTHNGQGLKLRHLNDLRRGRAPLVFPSRWTSTRSGIREVTLRRE